MCVYVCVCVCVCMCVCVCVCECILLLALFKGRPVYEAISRQFSILPCMYGDGVGKAAATVGLLKHLISHTHTCTHVHTHTQWIKVVPVGLVHFRTKDDGFHYSWNKPHTTVHNLIIGSLWADHVSSY